MPLRDIGIVIVGDVGMTVGGHVHRRLRTHRRAPIQGSVVSGGYTNNTGESSMKFKLIVCVVLLMLGVLPVMAQDSSLAGSWVLVSINGQAVLESAPITAEFSAEGIKGSAGCNAYFGTFTFDNTALKMSPLASTRKSCDGAA